MRNSIVKFRSGIPRAGDVTKEYVTVRLAEQLFGLPVNQIQDVFRPQKITKIPLARPEIAGSLNLRGRIVTVFDLRKVLGLPPLEKNSQIMSVVVNYKNELYSLLVDSVGEVMQLHESLMENNPANLSPSWSKVSSGVYQLEKELIVILNIELLLREQ